MEEERETVLQVLILITFLPYYGLWKNTGLGHSKIDEEKKKEHKMNHS